MLFNYLKIGFRNLLKYRTNSIIHILGLAIGLAAFLLINEYVKFEESYDRFIPKSEQLYRITTDFLDDGVIHTRDAMTFAPAGQALVDGLPEAIASTTTLEREAIHFRYKDKIFLEDILAADSNFLNIFQYQLISGDPNNLLKKPNMMVLTESQAKKYFGNENPVGQTIEFMSFGGTNNPFSSCSMTSLQPGQSVVTTAQPQANASSMAFGNPSP